jgi:hypothetical protein
MKKSLNLNYIIVFLSIFIISIAAKVSAETAVKIPNTINLSADEIKKNLPYEFKNKDYSIEILIYYFTDSVETLNFTEESGMSEYESDGTIKAILKIKIKDKTVKTAVIKTKGNSKENIIKNLGKEIDKILKEQNIN